MATQADQSFVSAGAENFWEALSLTVFPPKSGFSVSGVQGNKDAEHAALAREFRGGLDVGWPFGSEACFGSLARMGWSVCEKGFPDNKRS
ncbi:hypothetical protein [Azotobacter salinestris]|uniref:hypothetical protein n=1 Tax=Azotobacter salinestris TaxID=69964 RepID=UPI0032DF4504